MTKDGVVRRCTECGEPFKRANTLPVSCEFGPHAEKTVNEIQKDREELATREKELSILVDLILKALPHARNEPEKKSLEISLDLAREQLKYTQRIGYRLPQTHSDKVAFLSTPIMSVTLPPIPHGPYKRFIGRRSLFLVDRVHLFKE
jgi:hypothetical protein